MKKRLPPWCKLVKHTLIDKDMDVSELATKTGLARPYLSSIINGRIYSQPAGSSYTIVSGDTLWGIASRKLGSGAKWTKIYDANASTIEAAAKKHRKSGSDHGHWIYPGTTITIPAA